jgi:nucleoside-diphosphate-sugar epimerase
MNILLTGVTGFLGGQVLRMLKMDHAITGVVREKTNSIDFDCLIADMNSISDLSTELADINCVIHCAARAHIITELGGDTLASYRQTNTEGTLKLARQAAEAGVTRFIFISTIGVNGLFTTKPFTSLDEPSPQESYSISKYEAEIGLRKIAEETGMEIVVVRPPLVYGANAPGNFGKLAVLAEKNFPLPLGAINNKRSLVGIDNLIDLIATCIEHPQAANQTFLVSDDHDVSTSGLLKSMIMATGKSPFLLPIPVGVLRFCAGLLGKRSVIDRMSSNLQVDISHTKNTLGWQPPVSFEEGIRRCFK